MWLRARMLLAYWIMKELKPRYRWSHGRKCYNEQGSYNPVSNLDALRRYWSYYPNEKPPKHLKRQWDENNRNND